MLQHKEICNFPSQRSYDGKLETAEIVKRRKPDQYKWPNGNSFPFAFNHVEGHEESLIISTDKGNENSKKNEKEIKEAVSAF